MYDDTKHWTYIVVPYKTVDGIVLRHDNSVIFSKHTWELHLCDMKLDVHLGKRPSCAQYKGYIIILYISIYRVLQNLLQLKEASLYAMVCLP